LEYCVSIIFEIEDVFVRLIFGGGVSKTLGREETDLAFLLFRFEPSQKYPLPVS
jgi:hypothetical protein